MQPKPSFEKYNELITYIRNGFIQIPQFQRDFVWSIEDTARLIDSILKGYPVGTFILWKTNERLKSVKEIGNIELPETPDGDPVQYVIDGQQRLASLFVVLNGSTIQRNNKTIDYKKIYVDLDKDMDNDESIITTETPENNWITVYDLLQNDPVHIVENYREYVKKIKEYYEKFTTYDFSTIVLPNYPIEAAVEVFTRINTTGKELSIFEIMAAKTYDEVKEFDLMEKYKELKNELSIVGFDTIPSSTILQCISLNLEKSCVKKTILSLNKEDIINIWDKTTESIKAAIDYFRTFYHVPVSRLLPYNALLVLFSYFFFTNGKPNPTQEKLLQEYFWRASLSGRFSSAMDTRIGQDVKKIDAILNNETPKYDFKTSLDKEELINTPFRTGDSYCKSILCLLSYFGPKSFNNNGNVILDNSWLARSNSRNYHHFFPRKYLENNSILNDNSIVNITLVDEYLNKGRIRAKAPSEYMGEFKEVNSDLDETMKTHLIDDLEEYGIWENNYEKFLDQRSERIIEELQNKIEI
ncbi:MAG: GmrSD restriction endonuclease domain-containing protein [Methanobacterium sp.]